MWYICAFFLGAIFGVGIMGTMLLVNLKRCVNRYVKPIGTLRIDHSDPDGPYMFMEIDSGKASAIDTNKYVTLEVNHESYIPRE